jgi:hypothetical protein
MLSSFPTAVNGKMFNICISLNKNATLITSTLEAGTWNNYKKDY